MEHKDEEQHRDHKFILGIDPGINGGLVLLNKNTILYVLKMPKIIAKVGTKHRQKILPAHLSQEIKSLAQMYREIFAVLEDVHPHPKDGRVGAFNFGHAKGIVEGVLSALQIPYALVSPATWKRKMGLSGKDKTQSVLLCQRLFPSRTLTDHNLAEAALIAFYWQEYKSR